MPNRKSTKSSVDSWVETLATLCATTTVTELGAHFGSCQSAIAPVALESWVKSILLGSSTLQCSAVPSAWVGLFWMSDRKLTWLSMDSWAETLTTWVLARA